MIVRKILKWLIVGLFCLSIDFAHDFFGSGDSYPNYTPENVEFLVAAETLVPEGSTCITEPEPLWGSRTLETEWVTGPRHFSLARLPQYLKVWALRRLGQLSPRLFDRAVAVMSRPARPVLVLVRRAAETPSDIFSVLRQGIFGAIVDCRVLTCKARKTAEAAVNFDTVPPRIRPLSAVAIRGHFPDTRRVLEKELSAPGNANFGLLELLFPGADGILFVLGSSVLDILPYSHTHTLHLECSEKLNKCTWKSISVKTAKGWYFKSDPRWTRSANLDPLGTEGGSRWRSVALKKKARFCAGAEMPGSREIFAAWTSLIANDPGASELASRSKVLCSSLDHDLVERNEGYFERMRKSAGLQFDWNASAPAGE